jgi:D-arabinose 1-dehydrogenase-like Zn-dependent alcohol dehydrogenase
MLDLYGRHDVAAALIPIQEIDQAYERMLRSDVRFFVS